MLVVLKSFFFEILRLLETMFLYFCDAVKEKGLPSKRYVALFLELVAARRGGKTQQAAVYKAFSDHLDDAYKNFFLQKLHLDDACKKVFLQKRHLDDAYTLNSTYISLGSCFIA